MGDGMEKVCFSESGITIDKKRVIGFSGAVGNGPGRSTGKLVRWSDHEAVEGKILN